VVHVLEDVDFVSDNIELFLAVLEFLLDLDCSDLPCGFMFHLSDFSKCSSTEEFHYFVILLNIVSLGLRKSAFVNFQILQRLSTSRNHEISSIDVGF
jgi:hypothetical protein